MMKKRFQLMTTLLICLFLYTCIQSTPLDALIKFTLPEYEIHLDQTFLVDVNLVQNDEGFGTWDLIFLYDPNILSYISMYRAPLTQYYTYVLANEPYNAPGHIYVSAISQLSNGEPIPTTNTGILIKFLFTTKRQFPVKKTRSHLDMKFKDIPANDLQNAVCEPGEIEILPLADSNIEILSVSPSNGIFWQDTDIVIQGQGFEENAIPVVGPFCFWNCDVNPQNDSITFSIPAQTLPQGLIFDMILTNPDGDFDIIKSGYRIEYRFESGLNLFGYPTVPPENLDHAYALLFHLHQSEGDKIKRICSMDSNTLSWEHAYIENDQPNGTDFQIRYLKGNLLYVQETAFAKAFEGDCVDFDLPSQISELATHSRPGINLISIHPPSNETIHSYQLAEELAQEIGKVPALSRIQSKSSKWQTTVPFFNRMSGSKFIIQNTEGYILYYQ